MRIGVNARGLSIDYGGVSVYIKNILENITKFDKKNDYVIFYDNEENKLGRGKELIIKSKNKVLFEHQKLRKYLKKERVDLLFSPKTTLPCCYKRKSVITIHGLPYLLYPHFYKWYDSLYWKIMLPIVCSKTNSIIAVSQSIKNDLINKLKIDENKINVIYEGVNKKFTLIRNSKKLDEIIQKYNLNKEFIIFVGSLQPIKNIQTLLKAYTEIKDKYDLLIVGPKRWNFKEILLLIKKSGIEKNVRLTGPVSDDLPYLYNLAEYMVYPSFYEGFGLPLIESMACGCPLIASNGGAIPEVAGNAALYFDPTDMDELKKCMALMEDTKLRRKLQHEGLRRAKQFTWEKAAKRTIELFNNLEKT